MNAKTLVNFRLPERTYRAFKDHVRNVDLNFTDAVSAMIYFILGLQDDELRKFFVLAQDARIKIQHRWFDEGTQLFNRVDSMQKAIEEAIGKSLLPASFKKDIVQPGGLRKIEAAYEIVDSFNQKRISKAKAKKALAEVAGK